jgi:hypothetical protein
VTAPAARTGRVEVRTTTDPRTGRTDVRAAVNVTDWTRELLGQIGELWAHAPGVVEAKLGEWFAHRADEIENAGKPGREHEARQRQADVLDELLELADVAPDPSVLLGVDEVQAIARQWQDAAALPGLAA